MEAEVAKGYVWCPQSCGICGVVLCLPGTSSVVPVHLSPWGPKVQANPEENPGREANRQAWGQIALQA